MKIAQTLAALDAAEAMEAAESQAIAKDQNWTAESTKWVFADNSFLIVCGNESVGVDADSEASIKAYGEWLDDASDADVIELLDALPGHAA